MITSEIQAAISNLILGCETLDMDLGTVLLFDPEAGSYRVDYQWRGKAFEQDPGFLGLYVDQAFAWLQQRLEAREPFLISRSDDWPDAAKAERRTCERRT